MQLLCECGPNQFCHGDVLGLMPLTRNKHPHEAAEDSTQIPQVVAWTYGWPADPCNCSQPVTQASVACSVRNLFPGVHWDRLAWPLIEDLVNNPAFASFHQWALTHAPDFDGKLGPQI